MKRYVHITQACLVAVAVAAAFGCSAPGDTLPQTGVDGVGAPTGSGTPGDAGAGVDASTRPAQDSGSSGPSAPDARIADAQGSTSNDAGVDAAKPVDPTQTPPIGSAAEIIAWLAKGDYKTTWKCETAVHAPVEPGAAHGMVRLCENAVMVNHGAGEYPKGAAAVVEQYDSTGKMHIGDSMKLKVDVGGGDKWHWFEQVGSMNYANGLGVPGCLNCHQNAGKNGYPGHDFVFVQLPK
jgi:hypothetical protein